MFRFMLALLISVGFLGQGFCDPAENAFQPALNAIQKVLTEQGYLLPEYRFGVAANSTLAIQHAVLKVMKANPVYLNGEDRPWVKEATDALSQSPNNKNQVQIYNIGYLPGSAIDRSKPLLVDGTWSGTTPQTNLPQALGYTFSISYLAYQPIHLSVAYFRDQELAQKVQKQLIYTGASIYPDDLKFAENFFQSSKPFIGRRDAVLKTANASLDNLNNQVSQFNEQNGGGLTVIAIPSRLGAYIQGPEDQMTQFRANYLGDMPLPSVTRNNLYLPSSTETRVYVSLWRKR